MFKSTAFFIGLAIAQSTVFNIPNSVSAETLTFKVHPAISKAVQPICPTQVTLTQKTRPYYEGGYTIDGSAKLDSIAGKFEVVASDEFSVTWGAKLQRKYQNCQAAAGIVLTDKEPFQGHSYLRMRFTEANVYLILDMTGMYDANGFTPVILKKEVKDGNPLWTWAGTD